MSKSRVLKQSDFNKMTFGEFDQSDNGVRRLADSGKFKEAGEVITNYISANNENLTAAERCLLWFHAGQGAASSGNKDEALDFFERASETIPDETNPNKEKYALTDFVGPATENYLKATIAFLRANRKSKTIIKEALEEINKIPIKDYPHSNVVLIPGRVHDMYDNPKATYSDIFKMPPSLPPLSDESDWHRIYPTDEEPEGKLVEEYRVELEKFQQRKELNELLANTNIPGASIAKLHSNGDIETIPVGVINADNPLDVDNNTIFEAASLSKPVFAYLVLKLVKEGIFGNPETTLDRPLYKIAPDFGPESLREHPNYKKLTIRMILSHQAGLNNNGEPEYVSVAGERFDYSGNAYCFLRDVMQDITGKNLNELSQEVFQSLKMSNTSYIPYEQDSLKNQLRAIGHDDQGNPDDRYYFVPEYPHPGASLLTTAEDYVKFMKACLDDEFIKSQMFTPAVDLNGKDHKAIDKHVDSETLEKLQWGLGFGLQTNADGTKTAFHWGDIETSRSFCAINLDSKEAVVGLMNGRNGPQAFSKLAEPIVGDLTPAFDWLEKREDLNIIHASRLDSSESTSVSREQEQSQYSNRRNQRTSFFFKPNSKYVSDDVEFKSRKTESDFVDFKEKSTSPTPFRKKPNPARG